MVDVTTHFNYAGGTNCDMQEHFKCNGGKLTQDKTKLGGVNGLSFVIPLAAIITKDNLNTDGAAMCEGKPDAYLLDKIMTEEEVQQYFK